MNYYGINRKIATVDTRWVGPKARLKAKAEEAKRAEWLAEVATCHIRAKVDSLGMYEDGLFLRVCSNRAGTPNWAIEVDPELVCSYATVTITAPRWELIEEGLIDEVKS